MENKLSATQKENAKFFDKATKFYEFPLTRQINKLIHKKISSLIPIKPGSSILDAGCGTGTFLELLNQKNKSLKLYGIDVSPKMIEISKNRLKDKATINLDSIESFSPKNKFNYIFSIDSFHHYANQEKAILNFHQALKKRGKLIISDFSLGRLGNWFFKKFEPSNSRMLSKKEFKELFEKHKFEIIKQKRVGLFSIVTTGVK